MSDKLAWLDHFSMKFCVILVDKYAVTSWQGSMIFLGQAFDAAAVSHVVAYSSRFSWGNFLNLSYHNKCKALS